MIVNDADDKANYKAGVLEGYTEGDSHSDQFDDFDSFGQAKNPDLLDHSPLPTNYSGTVSSRQELPTTPLLDLKRHTTYSEHLLATASATQSTPQEVAPSGEASLGKRLREALKNAGFMKRRTEQERHWRQQANTKKTKERNEKQTKTAKDKKETEEIRSTEEKNEKKNKDKKEKKHNEEIKDNEAVKEMKEKMEEEGQETSLLTDAETSPFTILAPPPSPVIPVPLPQVYIDNGYGNVAMHRSSHAFIYRVTVFPPVGQAEMAE